MTLVLAFMLVCCVAPAFSAHEATKTAVAAPAPATIDDAAILNFALNLEYLEANFYSCAAYGKPIDKELWGGGPAPVGCRKAKLSRKMQLYAESIARDEIAHVVFLRAALGAGAVAQPLIDIGPAFVTAANVALNTTLVPPFDAYGNDVLFLHAAFIFEDVGVTAYKGAARLIANKDYLEAAAGILAVEAYHGGAIRTLLLPIANFKVVPYGVPVSAIIEAISALRNAASGAQVDQGLFNKQGGYVIAPADANAVAYSRTAAQVLSVVSLGGAMNKGGFFPQGLNGLIK